VLVAGTGSYITPRLIQAGQINLNTNTEPRSLSDLINFTQKSNLAESQLVSLTPGWEQALRTVDRYFGTSQVYKEACKKYVCPGGPPIPNDVEIATVNVGSSPQYVGVNPSTNRIYVGNFFSNTVSVIDGNTNTVIGTVNVGSPQGIGVNPTTNRVYVANLGSGTVSVINATNQVIATVNVGPNPIGVGVNNATNRVYVANQVIPTGSVTVINATNQVMATVAISTGAPSGVGVNPTTNRVYVTNSNGNTVSVIDGNTNTVTATVIVPGSPQGVAVNPFTNRIYVTNPAIPGPGSGTLSVIDGNTNTVTATVTVGSNPTGVGANPTTNRVYVANQVTTSGTASVIDRREEIREACLSALTGNCLVVSSTGTLFPSTPQSLAVNLVAVSLRSNVTSNGVQAALTIICDNNTTNPNQQCSALYVDGNVWGPGQTDLSKSPFIIQNAEPYFYLQFHWWDFANSRIFAWGTWWYGTASNPNWFWGVYWSWRTYVNYYIGIPYIPWWWWSWHWMYWRYWAWWGTTFQT
jgi:YVTN family beta-propeller protein